ncbi:MAG: hypothetical protein ACRERD_08525 [Candidatus Binatia bacterium]
MAKKTETENPFIETFGKLSLAGCLQQAAARSIDTNEKLVQRALEWNEKLTAWAKGTPLASLFEQQRSLTKQMAETAAGLARRFWQIEKAEEKAA